MQSNNIRVPTTWSLRGIRARLTASPFTTPLAHSYRTSTIDIYVFYKSLKFLAFFASCTTEANDVETEVLALFEVLAAEAPAALAELETAVLAAVALYSARHAQLTI